ncbi:hypothetical protein HMSSN139_49960 [Paenibacillus sp. HMSSN-139]|nr:hypothetical protein HMSSN139_49960 [Paenibacillus sp. HMSSN-139]
MLLAILLFLVAGFAEIGGGYLVWLWLRESRPLWYGIAGGLILIVYGIIPTLQNSLPSAAFYAAYGGVFIVMAVLWGWWVGQEDPRPLRLAWRRHLPGRRLNHALGSTTLERTTLP